jgi:hypothetical protein
MREYTLDGEDSLYSVAMENGYIWQTLWDLPENRALRELRKNPGGLIEGDVVQLPDLRVKSLAAGTNVRHRYVRKGAPPPPRKCKIAVEYGDFEPLLDAVDTIKGRQQRLQSFDYYHGAVDGADNAVLKACWRHFGEELAHAAGAPLGDDALNAKLKERHRATLRLDDDTATAQTDFTGNARYVLPGTFCFTSASPQLGNPLTAHRYAAEKAFFEANPALGRLPIVATVTDADTGEVATGVRVAFELVPAYANALDQQTYLNAISNLSERTSDPRGYVRSKLPAKASPLYGFNCPDANGGKTPEDVDGSLFRTTATDGFPWMAGTRDRVNSATVTSRTDAQGRTGVIFTPSRQAGDAYRIRVSVIHPGRAPTPAETTSSGVITIWRTVRIATVVEKAPHGAFTGKPAVANHFTGPVGSIDFSVVRAELTKAFVLIETDFRAEAPVRMSATEYAAGIVQARAGAANPQNFDLNTLVKSDPASPFLFWLEDAAIYNSNRQPGCTALNLSLPATWRQLGDLINELCTGFLRFWGGGMLPGLIIIRSEIGDSYSYSTYPTKPPKLQAFTTSGVANASRGCFVWYPLAIYQNSMPYGVTQNTMHEAGHVLYLRHHYTAGAAGTEAGGFSANHDAQDWCLMGYLPLTTNDYCGKCLLKLRGWDEATI